MKTKSRACILEKGINVVPLLELCLRDLMVLSLEEYLREIVKLVIGSDHFPYDSDTIAPEEVRTLVEYCKVRSLSLLLGCDANVDHLYLYIIEILLI